MLTKGQQKVNICDRIKELRIKRGWSQAELCRRTGIHRSTLSRYGTDKKKPGSINLQRLASALGVPVREITEGMAEPYRLDELNRSIKELNDTIKELICKLKNLT